MRCDLVRRNVEEKLEGTPEVQAHLEACPACREYLRRWERLRAGLTALGKVEPPEPSLGFAQRVARRLQDARESQRGQQFILQAGRRMVYATLLVAMTFVLGLVLPSSGPLRAPQAAESVLAAPQLDSMSGDQMMGVDDSNYVPSVPARPNHPRGLQPK